jgi:hypothetical protein
MPETKSDATQPLKAWAVQHDSHGICVDTLCFLQEGDKPEGDLAWVRLPWLDEPEGDESRCFECRSTNLEFEERVTCRTCGKVSPY